MSKNIVEKNMNCKVIVENKTAEYDDLEYKGACFKVLIPKKLS